MRAQEKLAVIAAVGVALFTLVTGWWVYTGSYVRVAVAVADANVTDESWEEMKAEFGPAYVEGLNDVAAPDWAFAVGGWGPWVALMSALAVLALWSALRATRTPRLGWLWLSMAMVPALVGAWHIPSGVIKSAQALAEAGISRGDFFALGVAEGSAGAVFGLELGVLLALYFVGTRLFGNQQPDAETVVV
ncbi:MAG: hypothetical protein AAGD38_16735 [Acidobacteriota bacterium]